MPIPVIILAFIAFCGTVNRVAHGDDFERKHHAWIVKNYAAAKSPAVAKDRHGKVK